MKRPAICLFFGVYLVAAQDSGLRQYTIGMLGTAFFPDVLAGSPFSGKSVDKEVRKLPNGTRITHQSAVLYYRDSMGRTRLDRQIPTMEDLGFIMSEIDDPVAGYHYTLDALNKVAYRIEMTQNMPGLAIQLPRPPPKTSCAAREKLPPNGDVMGEEVENEELGARVIEGLAVEGTRTTTKTRAGRLGNDKPLTSVQELWFSPGLCRVVKRFSSSQDQELTSELTNITTTEPDSSVFQIPPDYKTVDKAGRFEIRLTAPAKQ